MEGRGDGLGVLRGGGPFPRRLGYFWRERFAGILPEKEVVLLGEEREGEQHRVPPPKGRRPFGVKVPF